MAESPPKTTSDPRPTRKVPPVADKGLTPAMRQYVEQKQRVGDAILLFRMGDFYETFYDDAVLCARVLGIALTARNKGENPIPLAGIPYHALESYLRKLVDAGYKVAISEQMEDPRSAKGVVNAGAQRQPIGVRMHTSGDADPIRRNNSAQREREPSLSNETQAVSRRPLCNPAGLHGTYRSERQTPPSLGENRAKSKNPPDLHNSAVKIEKHRPTTNADNHPPPGPSPPRNPPSEEPPLKKPP